MGGVEDIINAAKPGADPEDEVLEAMYDSLEEAQAPRDDHLLLRLTLAGVRRVDMRSKITKQRVDFLWYATLVLASTVAVVFYLLYIHTNGFREIIVPIAGVASLVAAVGTAIARR